MKLSIHLMAMIDVRELRQFYNANFFDLKSDSYKWTEPKNKAPMLCEVEFQLKGGQIGFISSNLLKETQDAYNLTATSTLNLRKICDGVLVLEKNGQHYIAVLECKSGFADVKRKAIEQIPASYVKAMSILNDFSTFNKQEYKIFGLIVSYPYVPPVVTDSSNNVDVRAGKQAMIGNKLELLKIKYNKQLRETQQSNFMGKDFEFALLTSVKNDLFFSVLPVRHCSVANQCVNAVVDLDPILATL